MKWIDSEECREAMSLYSKGLSATETAKRFGKTKNQIEYAVKKFGVKSCISFREGGQIANEKRSKGELPIPNNRNKIEKAERNLATKLMELGFLYLGGYTPKNTRPRPKITICCQKCGTIFERELSVIHRETITCFVCRKNETQTKQSQIKKEIELRKQERQIIKNEQKLEKEKRLNEPHSCKVCGCTYTIKDYMQSTGMRYARNSGFCSAKCRDEHAEKVKIEAAKRRGTHSEHHYDRAIRLGLPAERGVTLKKLFKRDNGICQICGLVCDYAGNPLSDLYPSIDHIIPMNNDPDKKGGHTWANVQLAHRLCNSNKRDYVGEKWNNLKPTGKG